MLKLMFPLWETLPGNAEQCAVCEAAVLISKEDKRELRKRAEEEKVCSLDVFPLRFFISSSGQIETYA